MRKTTRLALIAGMATIGVAPIPASAAPAPVDALDDEASSAVSESIQTTSTTGEVPQSGSTSAETDFEEENLPNDTDELEELEALEAGPVEHLDDEASGSVELSLLDINDFHGRISGTLDGGVLVASHTVQFAGTIEELREVHGADNTIFVSAGDNMGASLFASSVLHDQPTIDLLNELDLRASALGNHEFDGGLADVARIQGLLNAPLLGANVFYKDTGELAFPAYTIVEAAGLRVGITGVAPQDTPFLVSADLSMLEFGDPVEGVNDAVAAMEALPESERPDIYVALYHEGSESGEASSTLEEQVRRDPVFAAIVNDTSPLVDVIFTAHTHQAYDWVAQIPGTSRMRPIVQTGQYGANIGNVVLSIDAASKEVIDFQSAIVPVTQTPMAELVAKYPDPLNQVVETVTQALIASDIEGGVPVGSITAPLTRAYTHGEYVDGVFELTADSVENRQQESPMGIAVSNALRDATKGYGEPAEFGVGNAGGLRADFYPGPNGEVTIAEARAVLPFNGEVTNVVMTGAQVKRLLEQQWDGTFQQLALSDNFSYTYTEVSDPAGGPDPVGYIWNMMLNGEPVDMDEEYVVATYKFMALGGDGFTEFLDGRALHTGIPDWQAWVDYLNEQSPITPDFARRAVKVDGPLASTWKAGESVTVEYSNLNMPAVGAPANTEATASVGSEVVTAPVEDGRTTMTFKVPEVETSTYALAFDADPTGTAATDYVAIEAAATPGPGGGEGNGEEGNGEGSGEGPGEGATAPGTGTDTGSGGSLAVTGSSVLALVVAAAVLGLGGVALRRTSKARG